MLLLLLFAFLVPKISEESTFLVLMYFLFLWLIVFAFFLCYILYLWVETDYFSTVLKQHPGKCHWQRLQKDIERAFKRLQQFWKFWPVKQNSPGRFNSVHTIFLALFFLLTHEHTIDAGVFAADKGTQSRWSHEGNAERQRIFWIAFASRAKLQAK